MYRALLVSPAYPDPRLVQDTLKTKARCLKAAKAALQAGRSVVVDATNRDVKTRKAWVQLAEEHVRRAWAAVGAGGGVTAHSIPPQNVPARAIVFKVSKEQCFHCNEFRFCDPHTDDRRKVPAMVIHSVRSHRVCSDWSVA